uniref:Uncharacterized protein n=1 Tax=Arundo donax TaxID=35708 RepID=A0A0A9HCF1_ARUDO
METPCIRCYSCEFGSCLLFLMSIHTFNNLDMSQINLLIRLAVVPR